MPGKPRARLVDGVWRDPIKRENLEYWRCKTNSIFCGGVYRPGLGLCLRCIQRRYCQLRGTVHKHGVFSYTQAVTIPGCYRRNDRLARIRYCARLFANKRAPVVSYPRVLYERVTKTDLPPDQVVVSLSSKFLPLFEELVVVSKGHSPSGRFVQHMPS